MKREEEDGHSGDINDDKPGDYAREDNADSESTPNIRIEVEVKDELDDAVSGVPISGAEALCTPMVQVKHHDEDQPYASPRKRSNDVKRKQRRCNSDDDVPHNEGQKEEKKKLINLSKKVFNLIKQEKAMNGTEVLHSYTGRSPIN